MFGPFGYISDASLHVNARYMAGLVKYVLSPCFIPLRRLPAVPETTCD